MSNENSIYVGSANRLNNDGLAIDLNLTQLREALKLAEVQAKQRKYKTKDGVENTTIRLVAWPLKEPRQYSTHSLKIDMYEKPATAQETPANTKQSEVIVLPPLGDDDLPF